MGVIYTVIEDLPAIASLPVGMQSNYQFWHLLNMLPGYSALLANPNLLGILQWTTAALLFLGLIGFQTRAALFLGGVGFLLIEAILRRYTYFFHSGLVLVYLTLLLPWTPCAATWSFDRSLNPQMRQPRAQSVGFSVYACFTVMAVIYLLCGLSKMRDSGLALGHSPVSAHSVSRFAHLAVHLSGSRSVREFLASSLLEK